MVGLVFLVFFVMSLLTNILGPLVPDIITGFHVSLAAAAFLPFSFFIAYGVMSIPAGFWVERFTEKPVMIAAFVAAAGHSCPLSCWSALWTNYVRSRANGPAAALMQDVFPTPNVKIGVVE